MLAYFCMYCALSLVCPVVDAFDDHRQGQTGADHEIGLHSCLPTCTHLHAPARGG